MFIEENFYILIIYQKRVDYINGNLMIMTKLLTKILNC